MRLHKLRYMDLGIFREGKLLVEVFGSFGFGLSSTIRQQDERDLVSLEVGQRF